MRGTSGARVAMAEVTADEIAPNMFPESLSKTVSQESSLWWTNKLGFEASYILPLDGCLHRQTSKSHNGGTGLNSASLT